jgi:hypothetical protein
LMKRANELRDILGIAKCTTLLSKVLSDQSENTKPGHLSQKTDTAAPMTPTQPKIPFTLRPQATEWTPPAGPDSPSTILKRVLNLDSSKRFLPPVTPENSLLPPFVPTPSIIYSPYPPGAYYYPPPRHVSESSGDGNQFISSLSSNSQNPHPPTPPRPIAPPKKPPMPPPGLKFIPRQQQYTFPLTASLLPQTFSVHLLSTLHLRFQQVASALENLDSAYASEILKSGHTQPPGPTRWETWMNPEGAATMLRALEELKKCLDELCGATTRAAWVVDTWGQYQDGKYEGTKSPGSAWGSADINGEEINVEKETSKAAQPPIGPPSEKKPSTSHNTQQNGLHIPILGQVVPALPAVNTIRPPPGLTPTIKVALAPSALVKPVSNSVDERDRSSMNQSKFFMVCRPVSEMSVENLESELGIQDTRINGSRPNAGK